MRILVVTHRSLTATGCVAPYLQAIRRRFEAQFVYTEDGWPTTAAAFPNDEFAACVWFVRFRDLREQPPFEWARFQGLRILQDHDAYLNFGTMDRLSPHLGAWPVELRRHRFDVLVASGMDVAKRLRDDGVDAEWVAKGYDPTRFFDCGRERSGIGTYGTNYLARRILFSELERRREEITRFSTAFDDLNDALNEYAACLVCNMFTEWRFAPLNPVAKVSRAITRMAPNRAFKLGPGLEPMLKNFEVAAAGCAPLVDWIPELVDLGFEDDVSMISYRNADELVEKLRRYRDQPETLRSIGHTAAEICLDRHTWDHRTQRMYEVISTRTGAV